MYPGMIAWWKRRHHHDGCGGEGHARHAGHGGHGGHCGGVDGGPHEGHPPWYGTHEAAFHGFNGGDGDDFGAGAFGVRRPLRFLASKLELDERQVTELADIIQALKTERAQAAVDNRRALSGLAEAVSAESFDEAKAGSVATDRVKSAEKLRDAVVKALGRIHALLTQEQRRKFAYLIRTGALTL